MEIGLQTIALLVALVVIGWGAGLAAAMAWGSLRGLTPDPRLRVRVSMMVVALLVATSCSYAYALVLGSVGIVTSCDVALPMPSAC